MFWRRTEFAEFGVEIDGAFDPIKYQKSTAPYKLACQNR
jgi:hypothetical protein